MNFIPDNYYDTDTYRLLYCNLNTDDFEYIEMNHVYIAVCVFTRWRTIINCLPLNYLTEYRNQDTPEKRNKWFETYLQLESKDMNLMPTTLSLK